MKLKTIKAVPSFLKKALISNYYWLGLSIFTLFLAFYLSYQSKLLEQLPPRVIIFKVLDGNVATAMIVAIAIYTMIVSISRTRNYLIRTIMYLSQSFILIFTTIGFLEVDIALHNIGIGSIAMLFIIYLTIASILRG